MSRPAHVWSASDVLRYLAAFGATLVLAAAFIVVTRPVLVGGTGSPGGSASPPAGLPSSGASASAAVSSLPPASAVASGTPPPGTLAPGAVAVTVSERVRIRSLPGVISASLRFEPLLSEGAELYVLDGPVQASGYDWFEVAPLRGRLTGTVEWTGDEFIDPGRGWVARAGKDGEPWIAAMPTAPDCPPVPQSVDDLDGVALGARLACFSAVPITLSARIFPCDCAPHLAAVQPSWLGGSFLDETPGEIAAFGEGPLILAGPSAWRPEPPPDGSPRYLRVDPTAEVPARLPLATTVTVTGMFDHPAARTCQVSDGGALVPTDVCRFAFVVTAIR